MAFRLLGGHLALDFVNTVGGRVHSSGRRYEIERERLENAGLLFEWANEAGLVTKASLKRMKAANGREILERAMRLREALYRTFCAVVEKRRPDAADAELLNRELANARAHERLTFGADGVSFTREMSVDAPLQAIAQAAADLLTSPDIARVRRCGGESCGWLFLDTSRNRSRQWCDMGDCGNVAKARRFRERQRELR